MGTRVHKLRPIELETPSVTELREASDPEGLFFMDGEEELRGELRTQEAVQTKKRLEWLLTPPESLEPAVDAITNGPHKNAEELAKLLRQMGFTVKLNSTVGGGLRNLRHTFLSIWTAGSLHGHGGYEVIVDPSFSEQFAVAHPTPRYTLIQSALPRVLVATPHRVLQAIMIMADELARAFKAHDIPLPPWRQLKSLISKYDAAESVDVLASLPAKPAGSAFASTRGYLAPVGGAAREAPIPSPAEELLLLASRFPNGGVVAPAAHGEVAAAKRAQQVKQRIANKLAQWGLEPAAQLAGASPTSVVVHDWSSDAGSPPSAPLPTQQAHRVVQIGFHVNERVCWGCHECVCGARLRLGQARFWMQLSQSLAAWKGAAAHAPSRRVAASAA